MPPCGRVPAGRAPLGEPPQEIVRGDSSPSIGAAARKRARSTRSADWVSATTSSRRRERRGGGRRHGGNSIRERRPVIGAFELDPDRILVRVPAAAARRRRVAAARGDDVGLDVDDDVAVLAAARSACLGAAEHATMERDPKVAAARDDGLPDVRLAGAARVVIGDHVGRIAAGGPQGAHGVRGLGVHADLEPADVRSTVPRWRSTSAARRTRIASMASSASSACGPSGAASHAYESAVSA